MKDRKDAIGFVFSGGGLQGIAHIGAVTALYEIGIRPEDVYKRQKSDFRVFVSIALHPEL